MKRTPLTRRTPLKSGSPLKRGGWLRPGRSRRAVTPPEWTAELGSCAVCGSTENVQGHHIIARQTLRILGLGTHLWDVRNRLPLCRRHHERHTTLVEPVAIELIPAAAWEFADEVGLRWWIEKHYTSREAVAA